MKRFEGPQLHGKKNLLITGLPGVGKTTLIKKLYEELKPLHPAGFYTAEIREGGIRRGFELIGLDGKRGLLSHVAIETPYRVGKYRVDVRGFEDFLEAISFFGASTGIVMIDEIGKMECLSERFKRVLKEILDGEKRVIATIASGGSGLIEEIKIRQDVRLFEMTQKNRGSLLVEILEEIKFSGD